MNSSNSKDKGNLETPENAKGSTPTASAEVPDWVVRKIREEYKEHLLSEVRILRVETVGNDDFISLPDVARARRVALMNVEQLIEDDVWSKKFVVWGIDKPYIITPQRLSAVGKKAKKP